LAGQTSPAFVFETLALQQVVQVGGSVTEEQVVERRP
jgi:hypothetical protein